MSLQAMAVEFPQVHGHPNRLPFEGVLTVVDVASDRAPSGARGHRVILTRAAAEAALPSLLGMAVDYKTGWDGHDARQKCGIITTAELDGRKLRVSGFIFAKDFPEIEQQMRAEAADLPGESRYVTSSGTNRKHATTTGLNSSAANSPGAIACGPISPGAMGMSYELADAHVADMCASIWTLTRATFTGAAILLRDKAAYQDTSFRVHTRCRVQHGSRVPHSCATRTGGV
jgi:hypothetical protein